MLRAENAHAFVMQVHDIYVSTVDDSVCMVMPKAIGTMDDIIKGVLRLEKAGGKVRDESRQYGLACKPASKHQTSCLCLLFVWCLQVRFVYQLLSALVFLHDNNLMHRDVKPDNVLVNQSLEPVLCDFSLCTFTGAASCISDYQHSGDVGTAVYMAPEVSLVWSLGL